MTTIQVTGKTGAIGLINATSIHAILDVPIDELSGPKDYPFVRIFFGQGMDIDVQDSFSDVTTQWKEALANA